MSDKDPGEKRSPRAVIFVVVGIVVIVVAIAMSIWSSRREEATTPAPQQAAQAPAQTAPQAAQGKAAAPTAPQAPAQGTTQAAPPPAEERPSFDVVRIARGGQTVMAGRAAPGATVIITDADKEVGRVKADERGQWVFTPEQPMQPGSRELALRAENPGGAVKTGEAPVILVVPEREKVASTEPGGAGEALAIKVKPGGGVQLLQVPASSGTSGQVSIEVVNFDEQGHLSVAGRAPPNAAVQVYLDNEALASATADAKGAWNVAVQHPLSPGSHTVRADQLGPDGKVVARAEISFTAGGGGPTAGHVTVAVGNSLWRIARRAYGSGFDYIVIYKANQDQIRNPDLIYPGQVFKLPAKG